MSTKQTVAYTQWEGVDRQDYELLLNYDDDAIIGIINYCTICPVCETCRGVGIEAPAGDHIIFIGFCS